jgi:hypothetical protein
MGKLSLMKTAKHDTNITEELPNIDTINYYRVLNTFTIFTPKLRHDCEVISTS